MKLFIGCMLSAVLGGAIAVALRESQPQANARAADNPRPGPAFPDEAAPGKAPRNASGRPPRLEGPASPLGPEELSQEEQVNIAVYDNVNRSVVNITTRGVRGERFFLMEI